VDDAEANDRVRQAVRELWRYRLANQIGDDDLPPAKVQEIAARFPDLGDDAINDYSHRLRFRLWAYQLARLDKLSNSQIRTAKRPPAHAHRGATMFPLYNEPGIQTIASLARTAPPRRTLLWAFTAHVFLHPKVEPQRPDPWTFKRYVRELWYWVTDAMFEDAVQQGAADGCCADRAAAAAMQQTPLQELWQALRRCTTEAELERFLQEPMVTKLLWELWRCATEAELEHAWHQFPFRDLWHELRGCTTETELRRYQQEGRDFRREEEAAYAALQHLIGDVGLQTCSADSLGVWRKTIGRSGYHWIVPVWFLTVVEQLNEQQLLTRLQVDDHEEEAVVRLARAIAARYAGPRGGGDQAVPGDSGAVHQPVYARQSGHGGQQRSAKGHPMDLAEAKEIIAAYLMGRSVMRQDLEHACERARSDARYVQYLAEELWIHADWGSECEAFLSQVTEFAAMSQAARQQTMPTSLAHVEACLSCRQAYWNVRPLWVVAAVVATKERARTIGKRLSEPIRLAVSKDGGLAERGCGPFSRTPALIPVPLLAPEEPEQKEWVLQDEDGQYAIRLVVCGLPSGRVMVSCTLQGEPSTLPQAQQVRIEVCKAESSSLYAAATLKGDQLQPIQLPPGSWVLRLEAPSPTGSRTWEIPVDIETEQAGERR